MRVPKKITVRWLRDHAACSGEIKRFAEVFPDGTAVSAASIRKAAKNGLSINWLAHEILPDSFFQIDGKQRCLCSTCNDTRKPAYIKRLIKAFTEAGVINGS